VVLLRTERLSLGLSTFQINVGACCCAAARELTTKCVPLQDGRTRLFIYSQSFLTLRLSESSNVGWGRRD
jgi:hypothetical protein